MNFGFVFIYDHLLKAFFYIEAIKSCLLSCLSYPIFIVPLLNGQPLLSGHFLKSRGWPLNRGRTVVFLLKRGIVMFLGVKNLAENHWHLEHGPAVHTWTSDCKPDTNTLVTWLLDFHGSGVMCTGPQMIPDRKLSPNWTANDPGPEMIPKLDRKWSRSKTKEWHGWWNCVDGELAYVNTDISLKPSYNYNGSQLAFFILSTKFCC